MPTTSNEHVEIVFLLVVVDLLGVSNDFEILEFLFVNIQMKDYSKKT